MGPVSRQVDLLWPPVGCLWVISTSSSTRPSRCPWTLRDSSVDSQGPADPVKDGARAQGPPSWTGFWGHTQQWPTTQEHAASAGPTLALPRLSCDRCWGRGFGLGVCAVGGCNLSSQLRPAVPLPTEPAGALSGTAGRIPASEWYPPPAGRGSSSRPPAPGELPGMRGGVWLSSGPRGWLTGCGLGLGFWPGGDDVAPEPSAPG